MKNESELIVVFKKNVSDEDAEKLIKSFAITHRKGMDSSKGKMYFYNTGPKYILTFVNPALELLMNGNYLGTRKILLQEKNLQADFFDLKTGVAGEILQKFSTYDGYVAIVGDFAKFASKSLKDFIFESNKQGRVNFVCTKAEGIAVLRQKVEKN